MNDAAIATPPATPTQSSYVRPVTIFTIPVDRDIIFSNHKGLYKKQVETRQRHLIVKSTLINPYLHTGEFIRCITTCCSPVSEIEQDLTGPAFLYFKRAFLIFTDRRILHIPTRFNRSPRGAISQIEYKDCERLDIHNRSLMVQYKNGKREFFNHISRMEKRKLRSLISDLHFSPGKPAQLHTRSYLCPGCTRILTPGAKICGGCKLAFKSLLKAGLWTFLIPGGAFFYFRYLLAGFAAAGLEVALIALAVFNGVEINKGLSIDWGLAVFATCGWIVIKLIGFFYARQFIHEFVPEEKEFSFAK